MNFELSSIVEADFEAFFYTLKRILNKRIFRDQIYYLIKWKDYDNEHNVWYSVKALNDVQKLIAEYETRVGKRVQLGTRRVRMSRRKITTATANQASSPTQQPGIEVCIPQQTTFRSTTPARREASRHQPPRKARRLEGYREL